MSKAREYFINPKGTWLKVTDLIKQDKPETHVHVVEYSAVTELEAEVKEWISNYYDRVIGKVKELEKERDQALAQLDKALEIIKMSVDINSNESLRKRCRRFLADYAKFKGGE